MLIIEAIGDITATASISEQPTSGPVFRSRLKGGILCGGVFSALAAIFGCFPQITFAQNNGVIQLSGVASRKVGIFCGALFVLFSIFPVVVVIFELLPRPVLGGALVVLFGTIATSGIRIMSEHGVTRRESIVIAASVGVGMISMPVSYTHLDVYKRQGRTSPARALKSMNAISPPAARGMWACTRPSRFATTR